MAQPTTREEQEQTNLETWRLRSLLNAGWTPHRAELLANRHDIDLHTATSLIEHGCPQKLALKILL